MVLPQLNNTNKFNAKKFYSFLLDGDVPNALQLLSEEQSLLDENELRMKDEFEKRFSGEEDKSDFLKQKNSEINDLLVIFRDYWRESFINGKSNDISLKTELTDFFTKVNPSINKVGPFEDDTLDILTKQYVNDKGLKTTGFGMTGKFYDLLVWKDEQDTAYEFDLNGRKISPKVVFMTGFVTLGWEEYATLGRHYPGGWATKDAIFCVKEAYDLNSESFLVSYLAHEGQHFEDYKLFPKLSGADLEYRSKLVELSLAKETLLTTLTFFINNAGYDSDNAHNVANYCVIRDLSSEMFGKDFVDDPEKWSELSFENINNASFMLLERNTEDLMNAGSDVVNFIKP